MFSVRQGLDLIGYRTTRSRTENREQRTQNLISIRPPEYFPRAAFLALVDAADRFVLADTFQYSRQSFQNRSPIRTPDGWQWISIPLQAGRHGGPVVDAAIRGTPFWIRKHWRSLHFNYRTAPFFDYYEPELKWIFERDWTNLGALTCATVEILCRLLAIDTSLVRASDLAGRPGSVEQVLEIEGRNDLLSPSEVAMFDAQNVEPVAVLEFREPEYRQNFEGFEPGLSALDLLFNYGPETMTIIRRASAIRNSFISGLPE